MFEYLAEFLKILVTGPQRSGTTICAAMIAEDLGYTFHPEEDIGVSDLRKMEQLFQSEARFVLQCPSLMRYAEEVSAPDTAVVLMCRATEDIIASEERIEWTHEPVELARYGLTKGPISVVKYNYWIDRQRDRIINVFDVEYESLTSHPLWVPKERRVGFERRQISEKPD